LGITPSVYQKTNSVLKSPIIVIQDSQVGHSGINKNPKQALSKEEYLSIYDIVNNPDEIYEDYTNPKWKQIAFVRLIPDSELCIKICVRFNQKSKLKDRSYLISRVTTAGKVPYIDMEKGNKYKKIE